MSRVSLFLRRLAAVIAYAGLFGVGYLISKYLSLEVSMLAPPGEMFGLNKMVLMILAIYILASALPFVPGAEIGWLMLGAFGSKIALTVYLCMITALCLAFFAGRLIPPSVLRRMFLFVGLNRAAQLVDDTQAMTPNQRLEVLSQSASGRFAPFALRFRYVALGIAFNVPGNSIAGGGGGMALFAGMSRLFTVPAFCLTTLIAVAPVPLVIYLLGWVP